MNRSRPSRREVSERLRADVPATPADDPFVATLAHLAASPSPTRGTSASAVRTLRAARGFKVAAASAAVAVVMAGGAYAAARVDHDRPAGPAPATDGSTLHGEDLLPVDSDRPDKTGDDALDVEEQTTFEHDDHAEDQDAFAEQSDHGDDQGDQGDQDSQDDQQPGLPDGPDADDSGSQQVSPPKGDRDGAGSRDRDRGDDTSDDTDDPENDGAGDSEDTEDTEDAEEPGDAETGSSDDASDGSEADDGGSDDSGSGGGSSGETDSTTD
jgi:hypothetical protein